MALNLASAPSGRKSSPCTPWYFRPVPKGLIASGNRIRCAWCGNDPLYQAYHDSEWGFPVHDDIRLFEKISLEGFQSGLSWLTILKKRHHFRSAFAGFDFARVARFDSRKVARLLSNAGIVRHRGKIESTINNAKRCADVVDEFGSLSTYVWRFEPNPRSRPKQLTWKTLRQVPHTNESICFAKDLKRRGWTFVGPTTAYAFMQAMGLVNDHIHGCDVRLAAERQRKQST